MGVIKRVGGKLCAFIGIACIPFAAPTIRLEFQSQFGIIA